MVRPLRILHVAQLPASPPRFGAQARMHGLLTEIGRRSEITAAVLVDPEFDIDVCREAMLAYCREVILVPNPLGAGGWRKRLLQLRSMTSRDSFERLRLKVPAFDDVLQELLVERTFDIIDVEFAHLAGRLPSRGRPPVVIDAHAIDHDLARQSSRLDAGPSRYLYGSINAPKLRREELLAFRSASGVCACSAEDERRILQDAPTTRTRVVPNAADVDRYRSRPDDPAPDGRTVLFFGLLSTFPNVDGVRFLLDEIWPRIASARPAARLKIVGADPPPAIAARAGPAVEFTGFVEDLRLHLASAAVVVVPLRLGGGTRLKIVEGMAMQKAVVSTRLGAEGIEAVPGRDLLLEDEPEPFADAVIRLLDDPSLAAQIGASARRLAEQRYSWRTAAGAMEDFFREIVSRSPPRHGGSRWAYTG